MISRIAHLLAACCAFGCVAASGPVSINVGGLFSIFDSSGNPNTEVMEAQAAFLMAIDELNNKVDGIFDDILPTTQLKVAFRGSNKKVENIMSTVELLDTVQIGGDTGVHALVYGLIPESNTDLVGAVIKEIVEAHSSSLILATAERYFDSSHDLAIESIPLPIYQGTVLQDMLCNHFNFRKIGIFYSSNSFGVESFSMFSDHQHCSFDPVFHLSMDYSNVDTVLGALDPVNYDCRVFVILCDDPVLTGRILESAYLLGLFRLGSQIFLVEESTHVAKLKSGMIHSTAVQKVEMLHGLLAVRFWSSYSFHRSQQGKDFFQRWTARASTAGQTGGPCDTTTDDTGDRFLYQNDAGTLCAGLDFASYTSVEDINPLVAFTYDAVILAAIGLHHLLLTDSLPLSSNAQAYHDAIINGSSTRAQFAGLSGEVHLNQDGVRENYLQYAFVNFNEDVHDINSENAFVVIGNWSATGGYTDCDINSYNGCHLAIFNTVDNEPPTDSIPHSEDAPPNVIKIAAYFNPLDANGDPDHFMIQHLAAFLMAVREINNKTDGLADDLLPNTEIVFALKSPLGLIGAELAVQETLTHDFSSFGINAAISALDSATTIQLNLKYVQESVLTMHSAATAAEFGDGASFPLKVQTNYIDTFQGMSWQHVFCNYFKYNRVTVIASGDFFGRMATIENSDNTYCRITHLMVIPVNIGATDVPQVIADAKESGANIFLFLISAPYIQLAAEVLAAGYFDGVFGEGKQILGSEQMTKPVLFTALEGFGIDVPKLMKGYMAMVTDANYHLRRSAKGASFIERWRDQPATQWMEDSIVKCDQSTDSIEQNYLYRSGLSMFSNHTCLGLSFSAFKTDGSDMAKFLGNTYDATYALAYAFNGLIESNIEVNGINLHSAIVDDVDFIGVSGHIDVFEGMGIFSNYGQGNREVGNVFSIVNFDVNEYVLSGPNGNFMVEAFHWTLEGGTVQTGNPIYNSPDNTVIQDGRPDILVEMTSVQKSVVMAFGVLCVLWSSMLFIFLLVFREAKVVKAAQAKMSILVVSGGILAGGRVINAAMSITNDTCTAGLWLGHIGFFLVFGSLLVKTWRIHKLLQAGLKKVKISESYVLGIMVAGIAFLCVYLVLLTTIGKPQESVHCTLQSNQYTCLKFCSFNHPEFHTVLFLLEACLLVYGAYLCYGTKGAPDSINEASFIAMAMTLICVVSALVFPLVFLIDLKPADRQLIASVSIAAVCMMSLSIMFWPKVVAVWEGQDLNWTKIKNVASSYASKISSGSTDQNATVSTYKVNNTKVVPSTDSMVAKSGPNSIADGMVSNVVTFEPVIENAGDFCDP